MFAPSGKTVVHKVLVLANEGASPVANDLDASSELSKIAKLNGHFRRNYGTFIGAILYLRTVGAARRSPWLWAGLASFACSAALTWLRRHGWISPSSP